MNFKKKAGGTAGAELAKGKGEKSPVVLKENAPMHSTTGPLRDVHGVIQRREEGGRRQRWPEG